MNTPITKVLVVTDSINLQQSINAVKKNQTLQYYSKWRKEWYDLKRNLTKEELEGYFNYHYIIRIKP